MIRLLGDQVMVRPIKTACSLSEGGILIPPVAHSTPHEGHVIAVGNGPRDQKTGERVPIPLNVGDYVTWERFADLHAAVVEHDGAECFVMPSSKIIAAF